MGLAELYPFPKEGAPSRVLTTSYSNPRCLYLTEWFIWTTVSVFRYLLWFKDIRILLVWGTIDGYIMLFAACQLFFVNMGFHHRTRYLSLPGNMEAKEITHCLAILHYKEPEKQLFHLVEELAKQPSEGKKVLIVGMERGTEDKERKMKEIEAIISRVGAEFHQIIYTIHKLRAGEIPGTCSNHFEVQVAAEQCFTDKTNVVFSKFDCNMRLSGDLLREIECIWCSLTVDERHSVTFMPNVCWCADVPDTDRSMWEIGVAWGMSASANMAPFSMSFVSGSLAGAIEAGYTPPSMLSEDELMFSKKLALLKDARTYRISSMIMKIFYPPEVDSVTFVRQVFLPKLERWYVGWLEVHGYLLTWLTVGLKDHPPIRYRAKATGVLCLSILRMYTAFVPPISTVPLAIVNYYSWQQFYNVHRDCLTTDAACNEPFYSDPIYFPILIVQTAGFAVYMTISIFMAIRIQMRLYRGFDCLKFQYKTLFAALFCAMPLTMMLPLHLLWTYFKHGMMNQPVVHIANTDTLPESPVAARKPRQGGSLEMGPGASVRSLSLLNEMDVAAGGHHSNGNIGDSFAVNSS